MITRSKNVLGMLVMLVLSLSIFTIVIILYFLAVKSEKKIRKTLIENQKFVQNIASDLHENLEHIRSGASVEKLRHSTDYEHEFVSIRESGEILSELITKLGSYSALMLNEENSRLSGKEKNQYRDVEISKRFRAVIMAALVAVTSICMYINISAAFRQGTDQMQKSAMDYEHQLSQWINTQKSILDMFCSNISTNPDILQDYHGMVAYLDRITRQYPEISATYMANPAVEHTVIMNSGWEPETTFTLKSVTGTVTA